MNHYYKTLELHKILELLAEQTCNDKTRELALNIEPCTDAVKVKEEVSKVQTILDFTVQIGTPAFYRFKDVTGALKRAKSGANLTLRELLDISQMLSQIRILWDWYKECKNAEDSSISYLFYNLSPNKMLEEKIKNSILSDEEIADTASPELASIRRKIIQSGLKIREHLDKMVRSSEVQKSLQENIITMRDGRYVLPVKSEHKNSVQGLVHDTSSSGATLFIEPIAVVEANNNIRILKGKEQEEIERIIAELSCECAGFADSIMEDYESCVEINLYFAKANLGAKMRGSAPIITDNGKFELKHARHPLIDKDRVVPIDVKVGYDYQALIITGPNTGGKTVVLKTVGLLTAMTMCGLLIPADDGSTVSVFRNILADIGDQQSIEQSLSTFSSHMNHIVDILKVADEHSLILLDELGSGTDPVEGAALAVSIIETLLEQGSRLMVTTHYQELKLYAIEHENVQNASCEFNIETLQPTYRLIIGSPGKSNAFAISSKLGISDDIIKRASALIDTETRRFEEVIERLEHTRIQLENEQAELSAIKNDTQKKNQQLSEELDKLQKTKNDELEKARNQAMQIVESVRSQSDELIDELNTIRKEKEKENFSQLAIQAKSKSKSTLDKLYKEANPVIDTNSSYQLPRKLRKGDNVLITDINKKGIVTTEPDNNGFVFIQSGLMKTKINIKKLRLLEPENKKPDKKSKISTKNITSKIERKGCMELDIRGYACDDGLHELDMFIDNAVMSNMGIVTIIHGKGTGILRAAVHRSLKSNPSVKSFRLGLFGEGEDGVTIVELK